MKLTGKKIARIYRRLFITALLVLIGHALSFSQTTALKDQLLKITALSDSLTRKKPPEKLYVQFNKPYYAIGDTIWFKAYLLNPAYFTASDKSGILYIDIANDSNIVIKQYKLPVKAGLSWGNISLDESEFTAGTYTLRAYTDWMRNFGNDYFFYRRFYISSANEKNLLVTTRFNTSSVNGNTVLNARLLFSDMSQTPFAVKPLQLQVMNGNRHLYKQKLQTGVDGAMDINFNIPQKSSGLAIIAETEQKVKKAIIPVMLNRDEDIDLQFLPEGGNLVAGLPAHIGFKAIGEDGKGVNVSGIVTDHERKQVAEFKSLHNGMGSFDLAVKDGENYNAKLTLPGGAIKEYPLPAIKSSGTVLQVKDFFDNDSLQMSVLTTADIARANARFFLIAKARGIVCYAAVIGFHDDGLMRLKIPKTMFPTGIARFTLMTADQQAVNERLVFVDQHDNLKIHFITDKPANSPGDSVALKIKVTDNTGEPVKGNFSLSVTDDKQVKTDTLNGENIITRLLLTSDLKGYVEEPGYYLSAINSEKHQALDNLLLTQGWVGCDWQQVFKPIAIIYPAESDFSVRGNVTNIFNKPIKGTDVLLFSQSPTILKDTTTDKEGKFVFDHFPRVDTPVFVIKAVNKNGKSFNVGINVNEGSAPEFKKPGGPLIMPWYVNGDSTLISYTKNSCLLRKQENNPHTGHLLREVKITAKKMVKDSQNVNGPPDVVMDEKLLEKAGKKSFLQLLEENVKGFRESDKTVFRNDGTPNRWIRWYFIEDKAVVVFVDGVYLGRVYPHFNFEDLKYFLESHDAEDIKGIEVMFKINPYVAFVEITTRGGHGPLIGNTPGMYLYKPLPLSWPKQFYKPKHVVKDTIKHSPDLRSTIDWEPNITTDASGEAKLWFYTADKPSTYTITIEGADMKGNLGSKSAILRVNPK